MNKLDGRPPTTRLFRNTGALSYSVHTLPRYVDVAQPNRPGLRWEKRIIVERNLKSLIGFKSVVGCSYLGN